MSGVLRRPVAVASPQQSASNKPSSQSRVSPKHPTQSGARATRRLVAGKARSIDKPRFGAVRVQGDLASEAKDQEPPAFPRCAQCRTVSSSFDPDRGPLPSPFGLTIAGWARRSLERETKNGDDSDGAGGARLAWATLIRIEALQSMSFGHIAQRTRTSTKG